MSFRRIRDAGRPLTDDDPVQSERFAPAGLIPATAERELQRWDAAHPSGGSKRRIPASS
ncbi:hypothetical protein H0P51_08740 [Mycobacterium vicinigordonae]|uniref:Uncharacterized protein n=1 Tax=Mycobacterium vicinigordonae TaxID=1719132 RepID=A0A7D6IU71_9MYCO|nr:hypothetical protein [Mycobacterium vicinigordonae]QLL08959.1 hypothetical protein H0P51_08740 [Mycobacterium vicinigordonae]